MQESRMGAKMEHSVNKLDKLKVKLYALIYKYIDLI